MISTGQLLVTILLIGRLIVYPVGAFILLRQWKNAKTRYYTDLPFLFGLTLLIMCIYTPIELIYVAFYPIISIESPIGQIAYLIDLNLITLAAGIYFVTLLAIWFPKNKRGIIFAVISWITFTEFAIILSAFVNISLMDFLLVVITLPMYIIYVVTFFFSYYQRRLPNVHSLLIGVGMLTLIIAHIVHSALGTMGNRLAGIYTDATWPAMIIWLIGSIIMFVGFSKKAPYYNSI
ncbi:MAG: hypothetical protein ACTSRG_09455 [Candidatus Helarchaeota archaeon]